MVDNKTGDSVFIPAISVLGQEPAAINTLVATQSAFETMGLIGQGEVPSIEQVVADLQAYGIEQVTDILIAQVPPGIVTHVEDGVRVDFGSHMVMPSGNILSGSFDASASLGSVGFPGSHPQGMSSPVSCWCLRARSCRSTSVTFRPTWTETISLAWRFPCGSAMKRPRRSSFLSSSYTPYRAPIRPPGSESMGKRTPPGTILESSLSCQSV